MDEQAAIIDKYGVLFEACDELEKFAEEHRPTEFSHEAGLIVTGTIARSDATFKMPGGALPARLRRASIDAQPHAL